MKNLEQEYSSNEKSFACGLNSFIKHYSSEIKLKMSKNAQPTNT